MYDAIAKNKRASFFLITGFVLLVVLLGIACDYYFQGGGAIAVAALALAIVSVSISYWNSDKLVLSISKAYPVDYTKYPHLVNSVEGLAIAAGVPTPKLYMIDDTAPNAFATGRDPQHGVICVTSGLVEKLDRQELEGVIAHEMSHIRNLDIRFQTLVAILVGTVVLMADIMMRSFVWRRRRRDTGRASGAQGLIAVVAVLLALTAPLVAQLIRFAISRQREYLADASGAMLTRYPEGLARALEKLAADTEPLEAANKATAHMYIVNPLLEYRGKLDGLFSTHPPTAERVKRLRAM